MLIIEDVEDHAMLIVRELEKGGFVPRHERVETLQELEAALEERPWDAIISDFNLPGFSGLDALRMMQRKGLDLPFLLVSGAIGEEKAAEVMRAGANDYIRKGNYARLPAVLERELRDAEVRRQRRAAAEELDRYRERLEELVNERTAELVRANEALQAEVTERRRAEEALMKSEERLRYATLAADIGLWNYDLVTGDLLWSDKCKELFGYPPDFPITYEAFLNAVSEKDRQEIDQAVQDALLQKSDYSVEIKVRGQDGRFRWVMSKGHAFYSHEGKPLRMDGIAFDITRRKETEEEIARLNADLAAHLAELEEANQELEAFNRMVSHDLRQPLNIMALACQQIGMRCKAEDESCKDGIKTLHNSIVRMNSMIDTLLNFSRSTHGELARKEFDLSEMVRGVVAELRLGEPGRQVVTHIAEGITACGDPELVRVALENLLGNAWKYTARKDEAVIEFGAREMEGRQVYFVSDNGKGFDQGDADKIFVPFQRLEGVDGFQGSGIGLATVERIIRRHGGRVWAEGATERGATFYFTLNPSC